MELETWPEDPELEAIRALARASSVLKRSSRDLSLAQYRVLSAIASGHERASHVAANLALGKPTVSAAVELLVQRRLIVRAEAHGDRRAESLRLTAAGEQLLADVEAEMRLRLRDLCARTPDGERLIEALVWLGRAVDERHRERREAGDCGHHEGAGL
jgi:DNA-binding MarR family transcriptional regulator